MAFQITRSGIRRGLYATIAISLASMVGIFLFTRSHMTIEALRSIDPVWLLAVVPLVLFDWFVSGYRIALFGRVFHPRVSLKTCMKANLANYFMGAVTPSQRGGGPAQIYVLHAGGMSGVAAASASIMTFVSTSIVLIAAAAVAFLYKGSLPISGALLHNLFAIGVLFFLGVTLLMVLAIVFPGFYREVARIAVRVLSRVRRKNYLDEGRWGHSAVAAVDRCHRKLLFYVFRRPRVFVYGILVTAAIFIAKFALAWTIVRSLGARASFAHVAILQTAIVLINYYFPSPGASGAAELSSAALMAPIVSTGLVTIYVVLWRLLSLYVSVAAGGAVMLHEIGKRDRLEVATVADALAGDEKD